jgi:dolichol-phosphate mannosyltransferase
MEKIVVMIPTYNEKENIAAMVDVLENEIFPKIENYEMMILVVDDNSPDGTETIVKEKMKVFGNIRLTTGKKNGLGAAFKRGIKYAVNEMKADAVIKMDADFQHDPKYIFDLVKKYNEGNDYVIGSRFLDKTKLPKELGLFRRILSKYGGLCARVILFFPHTNIVSDVSSGLKILSVKNVIDKIDFMPISSGFYYSTQLLYQAINIGIKITEIPYELKSRKTGKTKMSFSNIFGTLRAVILLRFKRRKIKVVGKYNGI